MIDRQRPAAGEPRRWSYPAVQRSRLPNGMSVLICRIPGQPLVALSIVLDVPASVEPRQLEGIGAVMASALREGTQRLGVDEFATAMEMCGTGLQSSSSQRAVTLSLDVAAGRLRGALELVAEALDTPALPAASIERLKRQRLDAITLERANAGQVAELALNAVLFQQSDRHARPTAGELDTVSSISRDDVVAHFAAHAGAAAATVVVVGDVDPAETMDLLSATIGRWEGAARAGLAIPEPVFSSRSCLVIDRPGSVQTELRLAARGWDRSSSEWTAASLAAYVLGGPLGSPLSARLREEKGYTYGISAAAAPHARSGLLRIATSVETSVTGAALADVMDVVETYASSGPTQQQCDEAVTARVAVAPLRLQGTRPICAEIVLAVIERLPDDFLPAQLDRVRAAGREDLAAAAARDWQLSDFTLVACGDAAAIAPQIESVWGHPVEVRSA